MKIQLLKTMALSVAVASVASTAFAASQTWSNAPVSSAWTNAANWIGNGVPGAVNSTTTADIATFNSPIAGGFGGAGNPITNDFQRGIRSLRFETVGCGAYVFGSSLADNSLELIHLGDISVSSVVTNPIIFNQGVRLRVPNSTNQRFDFTNDATATKATLFFNTISNNTANTRPWNVFLAGSNTGTNTIARIDDSGGGAAGAAGAILIDKVGTGTWILSGPNDLPQKTSAGSIARVQVIDGTLIVKDVGSLGTITAANLTVTNTGVLQIDGITPQNLGLGLRNGGTIRMNGTGGINGLVMGNQAALSATLRTTSASDVFTVGGFSVVSGGLADTVLHITGPGTVQLNSANTYVGTWSFDAGTNQLLNPSAFGTAVKAHVAAGAILDLTQLGGFYSLTAAEISGNGTGTTVGSTASTIDAGASGTFDVGTKSISLIFTPTTFTGDTTHPALYISQGTLSVSGNAYTINNASGTPLSAGTYRLIRQASGSITASGAAIAIVTGSGLAAGHIPEIVISGGNVDLVVSAYVPKNLTWQGGGVPDNAWDRLTTANWTDGSTTTFNFFDNVTFNSVGAGFPNVSLSATMIPGSVTVDATTDYSLGSGDIAGTALLTKKNTGALVLNAANSYRGGTVVSNGTVRVGIENAIPSAGAGDVAVYSPGKIDLNGFNNTINGLSGNGTVDINSGGTSTLTVGYNNNGGTFSGVIKNTSGTLGLAKIGNGTLTLTASNTYTGPTIISAGTLRVDNYNALGSGLSSVTNDGGTLNVTTNVVINGLSGAGGTVANNSSANTVTLTMQGDGNYSGVIANGTSGRIGLFVKSGTTRLNGICTYTNGTVVASGATLAVGAISPGASGQAGTGSITVSNESIISVPTALAVAANIGNNITAVDGALVRFFGGSTGNGINGQFIGSSTNTNVLSGTFSIGGVTSFSNFLGTVVISNGASIRWFNANGGGDNTTFLVEGGTFSRDVNTIRLGALIGANGGIFAPSVTAPGIFMIGGKGLSTTFSGVVQGSNNIVKVGGGTLTFDGKGYYTNTVTLPDTSVVDYTLFSNRVTYAGITTVSNGTLKVVAPNNLTNCFNITLAGGVLDASAIGYATNQTTLDINAIEQPTNTVVVTTATVQILTNQTLNGFGSILGSVVTDIGSAVNVGSPLGTLSISGSATFNGTVNMDLNRSNLAQNCDRITASSFSGSGATLNVTNIGPTLVSGNTFQLFSGPVSAFTTVNLPVTDVTGQITYVWQNNLAASGSITLLSGLNSSPTNITSTLTSTNTVVLSWPANYIGWTLQAQTNSINVGISNNWATITGSAATNQVIVPLIRGNPTVFYRMILGLP